MGSQLFSRWQDISQLLRGQYSNPVEHIWLLSKTCVNWTHKVCKRDKVQPRQLVHLHGILGWDPEAVQCGDWSARPDLCWTYQRGRMPDSEHWGDFAYKRLWRFHYKGLGHRHWQRDIADLGRVLFRHLHKRRWINDSNRRAYERRHCLECQNRREDGRNSPPRQDRVCWVFLG